ncbi:MAG TPA: hypothetical protein VN372_15535 [Methanospirillum sp.]|nr:hypothetical protein [Methanospirillum sp.]
MTGKEKVHQNRPHCLYLWFLHGKPVCSEERYDRPCAYPSWMCPVAKENQICEPMQIVSQQSGLPSEMV